MDAHALSISLLRAGLPALQRAATALAAALLRCYKSLQLLVRLYGQPLSAAAAAALRALANTRLAAATWRMLWAAVARAVAHSAALRAGPAGETAAAGRRTLELGFTLPLLQQRCGFAGAQCSVGKTRRLWPHCSSAPAPLCSLAPSSEASQPSAHPFHAQGGDGGELEPCRCSSRPTAAASTSGAACGQPCAGRRHAGAHAAPAGLAPEGHSRHWQPAESGRLCGAAGVQQDGAGGRRRQQPGTRPHCCTPRHAHRRCCCGSRWGACGRGRPLRDAAAGSLRMADGGLSYIVLILIVSPPPALLSCLLILPSIFLSTTTVPQFNPFRICPSILTRNKFRQCHLPSFPCLPAYIMVTHGARAAP